MLSNIFATVDLMVSVPATISCLKKHMRSAVDANNITLALSDEDTHTDHPASCLEIIQY